MSDSLTFATLRAELVRLGFQEKQVRDTHLLFEHVPSDTFIIIRRYQPNEKLTPRDLALVRRPLIGRGFLDEKEFDQLLAKKSA